MREKNYLMVAALLFAVCDMSLAAPVAIVNGTAINAQDLSKDYTGLNELQKDRVNKDVSTKREIVEGAINSELLAQAAKKSGLDNDSEFKEALEKFKRQYLATRYLQKSVEGKLDKNDVKAFFEKHKANYDSTQVRAMHILVTDPSKVSAVVAEAKKTRTEAQFKALAKKHSMDPTVSENDGDLGFFTRDRMVPEFAASAFAMKKGEVSGPVKTMYGYHVIKVLDIKYGRVPNFEEVEPRVKEDLRAYLTQEELKKLRNDAKITINEDEIRSLRF
jgi:peptidyl-prolyl cis-trans isomerase C